MYDYIKDTRFFAVNINTMTKNFFVNPFEKKPEKGPMTPSYIKPDGTQVIEKDEEFGKTVYEKCPDGALIFRSYNKQGKLWLDFARNLNFEIGHRYDEDGRMVYKYDSVYDENNVLAKKNEYDIEYHDNGKKKLEVVTTFPGNITTYMQYDENEKRIEKIVERGTVKTYYDENDKPIKREIDRGSGGIITEDLSGK